MIERVTEFMSYDMMLAMGMFVVAHVFAWYTHNSQFVWDFWSDKPILSNIVFGIPAGLLFWYGTKYAVQASGLLWSARFVAFSLSYVAFPTLTWWYMGESMFTTKTFLCTILAFLIILVQIVVK